MRRRNWDAVLLGTAILGCLFTVQSQPQANADDHFARGSPVTPWFRAPSPLAPADETFGRTRISPLEITQRIKDAERHGASYRGLMSLQGAIEDWTRRYPSDPWIAPREYRMSLLFAHLHSTVGNEEAASCRDFLQAHFPTANYIVAVHHDAISRRLPAAPKKHHFLGISWR